MTPTSHLHLQGRLHRSKAFSVAGLPGAYPLTLYLPPGYDRDVQRRYPVAYMFDGQNLFGDAGSFSGGWHLHEALDQRASRGKAVPIVVGIHHGGASRIEELCPWPATRRGAARADALLDWVTGGLRQMVAEDLRVLEGPEHTMVGGSSLGGLCALYAACRNSRFFGRAMVMSPSLWVGGGQIYKAVDHANFGRGVRLYLDCGGREGKGAMMHQAERLVGLMQHKGLVDGESLLWRPDAKGAHNEANWRRRLPKALRYLYG